MLESQFYFQLVLRVVFMTMFFIVMVKRASRNAINMEDKPHIAYKVLSGVFFLLAIAFAYLFFTNINKRKHSKKCTFYTLRFGCSFAAVNTIKPQLL